MPSHIKIATGTPLTSICRSSRSATSRRSAVSAKSQMSCMFSRLRSARASSCTVSSSRGISYSTVPFFSMRQMLVW